MKKLMMIAVLLLTFASAGAFACGGGAAGACTCSAGAAKSCTCGSGACGVGATKVAETNSTDKGASLTEQQAIERLHDNKSVYSCPMHQHVFTDKNGTCPICGMNLRQVRDIKDGTTVFEDDKQGMPMDMKGMNDEGMPQTKEIK